MKDQRYQIDLMPMHFIPLLFLKKKKNNRPFSCREKAQPCTVGIFGLFFKKFEK